MNRVGLRRQAIKADRATLITIVELTSDEIMSSRLPFCARTGAAVAAWQRHVDHEARQTRIELMELANGEFLWK